MAPKLKISDDLLKRADDFAASAGYASISEFVSHLIERELAGSAGANPDDEAEARRRLQGLGYID